MHTFTHAHARAHTHIYANHAHVRALKGSTRSRRLQPQMLHSGSGLKPPASCCVVMCCSVLRYDAACCSVLQCIAVRRNGSTRLRQLQPRILQQQHTATYCNILQHTATHCNTVQHRAAHCNTLQHTATQYNTLQHTTRHYNTLQHTATYYNTALVLNAAAVWSCTRTHAHIHTYTHRHMHTQTYTLITHSWWCWLLELLWKKLFGTLDWESMYLGYEFSVLRSHILLCFFGSQNMLKKKSSYSRISSRLPAYVYTWVLCTHVRIHIYAEI